jgi:hypothetical protein
MLEPIVDDTGEWESVCVRVCVCVCVGEEEGPSIAPFIWIKLSISHFAFPDFLF